MTYAEMADTSADEEFRRRVAACASEQALVFVDDGRPEFAMPAGLIINNQVAALGLVPLVAAKPGLSSSSGDPDILAAVQSVWPVYGATLTPPA